jgi:NADH:ubiquinone oxidoreductase subunit 4 (subunit M)
MLVIFIDDILIIATSYERCAQTILEAITLLTSLGFVIHFEKSVFFPQQKIIAHNINDNVMRLSVTFGHYARNIMLFGLQPHIFLANKI